MIPLNAIHGYILGQVMICPEPTPLLFYVIGLFVSELLVITLGLLSLQSFSGLNKFYNAVLVGMGLYLTYDSIFQFL